MLPKKCKKLFLILMGVLLFIACAYAENIVKPDGGNPLLQNLRVTRTWASTGNCITTLDAKWVEPTGLPEAHSLVDTGKLTVLLIARTLTGWEKEFARVYGASDPDHAATLWVKSKPIRDLIDFAVPGEEIITLEWWDTYSQYRILFEKETAANIDKLASYVTKMIANDVMPKATSKLGIKNKKVGGSNGLWHVGKSNTIPWPLPDAWPDEDILGPHIPMAMELEYIRPSVGGGPHRVVLNQINRYLNSNPFIYEADAYVARSGGIIKRINDRSGWWPVAYPGPYGGPIGPFNDDSRRWPDPNSEKEFKVKTGV